MAAACLAIHLAVLTHSGKRFGAPFNAAPGQAPAFLNPATDPYPQRWNRLVVSRWDAGQYIELGLRGYQYCPPRQAGGEVPDARGCNLSFYPTYGLLGRAASFGGRIPIDYALFAISLLASFVFVFLWTSPAIAERLGLGQAYLALLLFNVFTTGFALVTVQTEPVTLALTMGTFVALARRWWVLAAFLAGAASGMRITGVAVGMACAVAQAIETWRTRPHTRRGWARHAGTILLCGWGELALMTYHHYRFGNAFAYMTSHAKAFRHHPSFGALFWPDHEQLVLSMEHPLHEGVWLAATLLWFLLGHREALRRFPSPERGFWYALFLGTVGIASFGMAPIAFLGMTRYLLLALPLFFAMAGVMRSRPAVLALWLILSSWHYWNVDLCYYTGGQGDRVLRICGAGHWAGRI